MKDHATHHEHAHDHGQACGHQAIRHGDHVDYLTMATCITGTTIMSTSTCSRWTRRTLLSVPRATRAQGMT